MQVVGMAEAVGEFNLPDFFASFDWTGENTVRAFEIMG